MIGGALTIFGWFLPWTGLGFGSGPQIVLAALEGANIVRSARLFPGASSSEEWVLVGLVLALVVALIPVLGVACFLASIKVFEGRAFSGDDNRAILQGHLENLRRRAVGVLVLSLVVLAIAAFLPFGSAAIGKGYNMVVAGGALAFLGGLFAYSQLATPAYGYPVSPSNRMKVSGGATLTFPTAIGGFAGLAGGAITIIGWFLPWSSLGLGSGLQIALASVVGGGILGYLAEWANAAYMALIPLLGALCLTTSVNILESRLVHDKIGVSILQGELRSLRGWAIWVILLMFLIFILVVAVPFGNIVLGRGFYLTAGGAVIAFLGALWAQIQIPPLTSIGRYRGRTAHYRPQLTEEERELLEHLAQERTNEEIARLLGITTAWANARIYRLMEKFEVKSRAELISVLWDMGYLPPARFQ
jgi:DNA-binding CsgD family transcriptional regulator